MSWHTEVLWYYPEFPECWEIMRMRKQWIPGPFDFSNGPGNEANGYTALDKANHLTTVAHEIAVLIFWSPQCS